MFGHHKCASPYWMEIERNIFLLLTGKVIKTVYLHRNRRKKVERKPIFELRVDAIEGNTESIPIYLSTAREIQIIEIQPGFWIFLPKNRHCLPHFFQPNNIFLHNIPNRELQARVCHTLDLINIIICH